MYLNYITIWQIARCEMNWSSFKWCELHNWPSFQWRLPSRPEVPTRGLSTRLVRLSSWSCQVCRHCFARTCSAPGALGWMSWTTVSFASFGRGCSLNLLQAPQFSPQERSRKHSSHVKVCVVKKVTKLSHTHSACSDDIARFEINWYDEFMLRQPVTGHLVWKNS